MNQLLQGSTDEKILAYERYLNDISSSLSKNFVNYINGVEIRMAGYMGRGVFATRNLQKGEFLIAEKAIATGYCACC